jgi:hypothetical protein
MEVDEARVGGQEMFGLLKRFRGRAARTGGGVRRIAILTSTRPLRVTTTRRNRTKERFNSAAALELAERFDVILVGSTASDSVFEYIGRHLTAGMRQKFHFYNRTYFESYAGRSLLGKSKDERSEGWRAILRENGIEHELTAKVLGDDFEYHSKPFDWTEIGDFISDKRVMLVTGKDGQLFYEKPRAVGQTE